MARPTLFERRLGSFSIQPDPISHHITLSTMTNTQTKWETSTKIIKYLFYIKAKFALAGDIRNSTLTKQISASHSLSPLVWPSQSESLPLITSSGQVPSTGCKAPAQCRCARGTSVYVLYCELLQIQIPNYFPVL